MNDDTPATRSTRRKLLAGGLAADGLGVELLPVDPARIWGLA